MRSPERARMTCGMLMLMIGMTISGCTTKSGSDSTVISSSSATTIESSPGSGPRATHAQLLAEARENYSFSGERNAEAVDTSRVKLPGGPLPTITIATGTRRTSGGRLSSSRFTGRLTSSGAYPRMGLAPGVNYIWRDSLGGSTEPARTLIVPSDTTYPMRWQQHEADRTPLFNGASALPRLVKSTKGYGACDSGCGGGHCVVQEGSTTLTIAADSTVIFSP